MHEREVVHEGKPPGRPVARDRAGFRRPSRARPLATAAGGSARSHAALANAASIIRCVPRENSSGQG